jgi:hypothetical protein
VRGRGELGRIGGLRGVRAASARRAARDPLARQRIDPPQVLIRMRRLLSAVMLLVQRGGWGTLPAAFGPVKRRLRRACQHGRTGGETAGVPFWGEPQGGEGVLEDRPQLMTPVVGLRLTHITLQRVHRLQGRGFLRDQNKQQFVFKAWPPPFGSAACTALPEFACTCARARIQVFGGSLKRWQELLTFCQRYAGCCSKVAWSVFQLVIAQHHTEYTLFPIRSNS